MRIDSEILKCESCVYFESYYDAYYQDEFEPEDIGFCHYPTQLYESTVDYPDGCEHYEPKKPSNDLEILHEEYEQGTNTTDL